MGTFTNATQLAKRQSVRFAHASLTMQQATHELAKGGQADFLSQLTGKLSEDQLRQIGHPYARGARALNIGALKGYKGLEEHEVRLDRNGGIMRTKKGKLSRSRPMSQVSPKGKVSLLPINKQSGKLRRGVALMSRRNGGSPVYDLFASVPYAKHVLALEGTRYMLPRGLLGPKGLIRKRHKARHNALVDPVRRSLRKP